MNILITGGTGFVGKTLCEKLFKSGHELTLITRNEKRARSLILLPFKAIECDLMNETFAPKESYDCVINLVGENIGEKRWSEQQKKIILDSRVKSTKNLFNSLNSTQAISKEKKTFFIQASATGYYSGDYSDNDLTEQSVKGSNFLSEVCERWEAEAASFKSLFTNFICLRFGLVLGDDGGLLEKLIPLYRLGLGGKIGDGKQWMSWIHKLDLVRMIEFCLSEKLEGTFNAVSNRPVRNKEFNKVLGNFTDRAAIFSAPKFMLKLVLGERSCLALDSQKVRTKITDLGFKFQFVNLNDALKNICQHYCRPPQKKESFHHTFRQAQYIDLPLEEVAAFFSEAKNLEYITPDYLNFKITYQSTSEIQEGTIFKYKMKVHGFPVRWKTQIINWKSNESFTDFQERGPYKTWYHVHDFYKVGRGTLMIDKVNYKLPFGHIGETLGLWLVKRDVPDIFTYRSKEIYKYLGKNHE